MPSIVNNVINKMWKFLKEFFHGDFFEHGSLDVTPRDNSRILSVKTKHDVVKVWFSLIPHDLPYHDETKVSWNYVSEAIVSPGGFIFRVNVSGHCRIDWFTLED